MGLPAVLPLQTARPIRHSTERKDSHMLNGQMGKDQEYAHAQLVTSCPATGG